MNTDHSSIPDWELLDRYVVGECTPGERGAVASWLEASPEAQAIFAGLRDGARAALPPRRLRGSAPQAPLGASTSRPATRRSGWSWYAGLSAIALLLVWGSWSWTATLRNSGAKAGDVQVVTTATRERARVQLPDGSSVLLAPASELRYVASPGSANRMVSLRGAALFTVTRADAIPFVVSTAYGKAQVLGTSFTVRHYDEDSTMQVVVASGRVGVGKSVLSSGEAVRVSADGAQQVTHAVNVAAALAWTHGRLEFRSEPLRNVIPELERWSDIRVDAHPSLLDKTITMSLTTESRPEIVHLLTVLLGATARQNGERTVLSPR